MSIIQGTVISYQAEVQATNQAGKPYKAWRLIYTDSAGEVKNLQKPVTGLKFNRALAGQLASVSAGDFVTIVQEKNDAGFLDVKSVTKGDEAPAAALSSNDKQPSRPAAASGGSRDFETSKERADRQVYIVRQSSLERAVELYPKKSPQELVEVAEFFKEYIFNGLAKPTAATSDDDFQDDIPY